MGRPDRALHAALLRLLPDVFFHPVWTYFVEANTPLSPEQIQPLSDAVELMLAAGQIEDACQTLFVAAFQHLRAGEFAAASSHIQRVLLLSEQHGLLHVAGWATWGAAAVCVKRGWYQQADEHLEHLHSLLSRQQEWVLSDVIDVLRQGLLSQSAVDESISAEPVFLPLLDSTVMPAIEQLLHWGEPPVLRDGPGIQALAVTSPVARFKYRWRGFWQRIARILKGELRLQWVDTADSRRSRLPGRFDEVPGPTVVRALPSGDDQPAPIVPPPDVEPKPIEPAEPTPGPPVRPSTATLTVYILGAIHLAVNDTPANHTISGKSRTVFEYLLIHHDQPVSRDVLMDVFWPNAAPDSARNRLNVALHHVRQALRAIIEIPIVLFEEGAYCINPEFDVWIDAEEFERHVKKGRQLEAADRLQAAIKEYELARDLYQGDFLADEPYEDWPVLMRERLRSDHLDMLDRLSQIYFSQNEYSDCAALCQSILSYDNCREDAHCRLMQCYSRQNQRYLALRQYQVCVKVLHTELDVEPAATTTQLYERIRRRERV